MMTSPFLVSSTGLISSNIFCRMPKSSGRFFLTSGSSNCSSARSPVGVPWLVKRQRCLCFSYSRPNSPLCRARRSLGFSADKTLITASSKSPGSRSIASPGCHTPST